MAKIEPIELDTKAMKGITVEVTLPKTTLIRLKLSVILIWLAVKVGGYGKMTVSAMPIEVIPPPNFVGQEMVTPIYGAHLVCVENEGKLSWEPKKREQK